MKKQWQKPDINSVPVDFIIRNLPEKQRQKINDNQEIRDAILSLLPEGQQQMLKDKFSIFTFIEIYEGRKLDAYFLLGEMLFRSERTIRDMFKRLR